MTAANGNHHVLSDGFAHGGVIQFADLLELLV